MEAAASVSTTGDVSDSRIKDSEKRDVFFRCVAIFFSYVIIAELGYLLFTPPAVVSPAAGVAMALLFVFGIEYAPVIFVAALVSYLLRGASWGTILVIPFAQALQAAVGAHLLKRFNFDILINKLSDVLALIFVSLVASTIVPTFGVLRMYLNAHYFTSAQNSITWGSWWVGTMTSLLIVGAFTVRWVGKPHMNHRSRVAIAEALGSVAAVSLLSYVLFWTHITSVAGVSLVYVLLLPLFWVSLRAGPRFTTLALFLVAGIAITGTLFGVSAALKPELLGTRIFQVEIFLVILALIFLVLVTIEESRKETLSALNGHVKELQHAFKSLHAQDRMRSEFLAVLAHELRNPLAPLVSSLEALKIEGLVNAEGAGPVKIMENQLQRLCRLLDDLLDIARLSQQKLTLQRMPIDINMVAMNSLESVRSIIKDRSQQLDVHILPERVFVNGDSMRLEQACINLLNNASKFSSKGSSISLSMYRFSEVVEIHVTDSGIGIEPGTIEHIFEPFNQGKSSNPNDGIGVGLTLAKNIVEMHNGSLHAVSPGHNKGSDFIISLPVLPDVPDIVRRPFASETADRGIAFKGYRILVVDDNEMAANGMAKLLTLKGYVAKVAYTGKEAQATAGSFQPHAMILDIALPDTDGYSLARHFRGKFDFHGLLVALTGYGQEENKHEALQAGFDYHLTKPVGIADLQAVLVAGLESARIVS
ncbi:MAG TPA: ATP-binding protein [Candidatus Paceibacterota bacterium]|nr:ATP-binding protein [Candidatus Paceibacterota bacterium]